MGCEVHWCLSVKLVGGSSCGLGVGTGSRGVHWCVRVVSWGMVFLLVGGRGSGEGGPLVYECCKIVGGTPCGLGVGGWWVPSVYVCCKIVGCTPCGLVVGGGGRGSL